MKTNTCRPTYQTITGALPNGLARLRLCPRLLCRLKIAVVAELLAVFLIGCATESGSNTVGGALIGSAVGALAGGAVGSSTQRAGTGAAIGAGVGGLTGAAIGSAADAKRKQTEQRAAVPAIQYTGPKITVAVREILNKTGVYAETERTGTTIQTGAANAPAEKKTTIRDPIGTGARDQLITALSQVGVFQVSLNEEQAQYIFFGAITGYDPNEKSAAGGFGWGSTPRPQASDPTVSAGNLFVQVLRPTAAAGFAEQGYVSLNIHLLDRNGIIVASTILEAHPKAGGGGMNLDLGGLGRSVGMPNLMADAGFQKKTPLQQAVQICMYKAAAWAAEYVVTHHVADTVSAGQASASSPTSAAPSPAVQPATVFVTMKDGSEIKGTLELSTLKFNTAYGERSVQSGDIVEFKDGYLILRDGNKLKGNFEGSTMVIKAGANVMNLPGGDIVSILGRAPGDDRK